MEPIVRIDADQMGVKGGMMDLRHRYIAGIEQTMDVSPQQESVPCLMRAAIAIGAYMRSLQGRQCSLLGNRAAPPIDIRDKHPECSLPEAGANERGAAKTRRAL